MMNIRSDEWYPSRSSNGSASDEEDTREDGPAAYQRPASSVLLHPVALPLTRYFFHEAGDVVVEEDIDLMKVLTLRAGLPATAASSSSCEPSKRGDGVFRRCHENWLKENAGRGGTALTERLRAAMRDELGDFCVSSDEAARGSGLVDAIVHPKTNGHPLLLVQLGLNHDKWWKKYAQASEFLERHPPVEGNPVLIAVVSLTDSRTKCRRERANLEVKAPKRTISQESPQPKKKTGKSAEAADTAEATNSDPAAAHCAAATRSKSYAGARIAVFLAVPKKPDRTSGRAAPHRVALLWHGLAGSVESLSKQFGWILRATIQLPGWIEASRDSLANKSFVCLGPDCCKISIEQVSSVLPMGRFGCPSSRLVAQSRCELEFCFPCRRSWCCGRMIIERFARRVDRTSI
jgi:hypothetical protein